MLRKSLLASATFGLWCGFAFAQEPVNIDALTQQMAAEVEAADPVDIPQASERPAVQSTPVVQSVAPTEDAIIILPDAEPIIEPIVVDIEPQPAAESTPSLSQEELSANAADAWMDRTTAVGMGSVGRLIQTYDGSITRLVCQTDFVCNVEFEEGEMFSDTPILADPVRWIMTPRLRTSPEGIQTQYLAIKPSSDAQTTTLAVYTDRRIYPIMLVPSRTSHTHILAYSYPDTREREMREHIAEQAAAAEAKEAREAATRAANRRAAQAARAAAVAQRGVETSQGPVPAEDLDFNYSISGNTAFRPVRVYTDGQRTYVDLPDNYRGETPILMAGNGQSNGVVNVRVSRNGRQIIADRSLSSFSLQVGRNQVRVTKQ